ncbi:hypothetical protein Syun_016395 [Stephania yunnanensis]|uniref:Uncharacterized protein n=1 Tax=Stephania yunnanensis TaxID=152371 RepID=A0AAP0P257_9MAGN
MIREELSVDVMFVNYKKIQQLLSRSWRREWLLWKTKFARHFSASSVSIGAGFASSSSSAGRRRRREAQFGRAKPGKKLAERLASVMDAIHDRNLLRVGPTPSLVGSL